jgi:hypothetical protein
MSSMTMGRCRIAYSAGEDHRTGEPLWMSRS